MPSSRAKPSLRRQVYLALSSKIESQLRDLFTARAEDDGLTQSAVADKLGINRSVVSRRLNGRTNMTVETIAEMVWAGGGCIDVKIYDPAKRPDKNHALADKMLSTHATQATVVTTYVPLTVAPRMTPVAAATVSA